MRLECAQCHHHPFEKWGQDDFYGLAAFFNGLQRKKLAGDEELVFHAGGTGEMRMPRHRPGRRRPPAGRSGAARPARPATRGRASRSG